MPTLTFAQHNTRLISSIALAAVGFALTACGGGGGGGVAWGLPPPPETPATLAPKVSCASLQGQTYLNVKVVAAADVAASGEFPAYCKVSATEVGTEHDIELRFPKAWARRYVQEGGGGFDGVLRGIGTNGRGNPQLSHNVALSAGAIQAVNNGGHRDSTGAAFLNNPAAVQRYAHTAITTTAQFAKAVASAYYGESPRYSYYEGCSNGGRGALNAADKYGDVFDGVIAGAPTRNLGGQIVQWTRQSNLAMPSAEKLAATSAAATAKCDAADGLSDGIVANWKACRFDPAKDTPPAVGLSAEEAGAIQSLWQDLLRADGSTLYSGYGFGTLSSGTRLGVGHMQFIVMNDGGWTPAGFDVESSLPVIGNVIDVTYQFNASTAGLARFMRDGKKVMVWHGADDGLLSHRDTIRTWQQVTNAAGEAVAQANSRLYIAPGVNHCAGGSGPDRFDLLTPMMAWVEKGIAPETPVAQRVDANGAVMLSRPLCVYPQYAKYRGTGDVRSAASFVCTQD